MNALMTPKAPNARAVFTRLALIKRVDFMLAIATFLHSFHILTFWWLFLILLLRVLDREVADEWFVSQALNLWLQVGFH